MSFVVEMPHNVTCRSLVKFELPFLIAKTNKQNFYFQNLSCSALQAEGWKKIHPHDVLTRAAQYEWIMQKIGAAVNIYTVVMMKDAAEEADCMCNVGPAQ